MAKSLEYVKEKHGLITCIITHIGLSLAGFLAFLDILILKWNNI